VPLVQEFRFGSGSIVKSNWFLAEMVRTAGLIAAAWCLIGGTSRVACAAAGYKVVPVDDDQKQNNSKIREILRNGAFETDEAKTMFGDYYKRFVLPRWTLPELRGSLVEERKRLQDDLRLAGRAEKPPAAHDELVALLLKCLTVFAKDNYDPAVRVNAMLMIGELNTQEGRPPVPLVEALPVLVAALKDPQQLDAVRVAALVGLERHCAAASQSGADLQAAGQALAEIVGTPGKAAPPAGDAWIRKRAAEALGKLKSAGPGGANAKALQAMVLDKTLHLSHRCAAAEALGELDFSRARLDLGPMVQALGRLAAEVLTAELDGGPSRQRLRTQLGQIVHAAKALGDLVKDEGQAAIVQVLIDAEKEVLEPLDKTDADGDGLTGKVRDLLNKLPAALRK
jgi:hypothetical protein